MTTPPPARGGRVLLISCYELGQQPLGVARPLGALRRAGLEAHALDLALDPGALDGEAGARALDGVALAGVSVPMHTALRVGVAAARAMRRHRPDLGIAFHGLYARLNAAHLLRSGLADFVIGPEAERPLASLAAAVAAGASGEAVDGVLTRTGVTGALPAPGPDEVPEPGTMLPPDRIGLPPLEGYAHLQAGGEERLVAAVEASRGCKHTCRHCPITPLYQGRFFVVPPEVVLEDVAAVVAAGAGHVSFADPDFLNGPRHALRVARALHRRFPDLTFDFTAKVEHLLAHRDLLPELAACGALFVVSAVESLSDTVLGHLAKGHTRDDVFTALGAARAAGLTLRPSLLPFTPWSTLDDYQELLAFIEDEDLVDCVDPVQLTIRLLVPPGSPLATSPAMAPHLRGLAAADFSWRWTHPDPRMDALQREAADLVSGAVSEGADAALVFQRIARAADAAGAGARAAGGGPLDAGTRPPENLASSPQGLFTTLPPPQRRRPPRLTEPWFC